MPLPGALECIAYTCDAYYIDKLRSLAWLILYGHVSVRGCIAEPRIMFTRVRRDARGQEAGIRLRYFARMKERQLPPPCACN